MSLAYTVVNRFATQNEEKNGSNVVYVKMVPTNSLQNMLQEGIDVICVSNTLLWNII
jgi:hypothetical protein